MTSLTWLYTIPGYVSLFWPLYFMFIKKDVSRTQWLLALSQTFVGLSIMFYADFSNENFRGEYFISIVYSMLALFSAPVFYLFVSRLTNPAGITSRVRKIFIFPVLASVIILASAIVGGRENYRLLLERVIYMGDDSKGTSVGYNQLLIFGYYFFVISLVFEVVWVMLATSVNFKRYHAMLGEYLGANRRQMASRVDFIVIFCTIIVVLAIALCLHQLLNITNIVVIAVVCSIATVLQLLIGFYANRVKYTAEDIMKAQSESDIRYGRVRRATPDDEMARFQELSRQMTDIVETQEGYLDHTISLASVSEKMNVSQAELIDMLHTVRGCSFAEYVDGLRIKKAIGLILEETADDDSMALKYKMNNTLLIETISYNSGFDTKEIFFKAFDRVMGQTFRDWLSEGIAK